ncbi:MAG TPA: hypothetical protein VK530_06250 [Candidatus Acidoferrum sp.]|nr:hypothetical protein [Candidatus Acidoferrum sp.]
MHYGKTIGTLSIDNVRLGLTFASVIESPAPSLKILNTPPLLRISWPASANGFVLEEKADLTTTNWLADSNSISTADGENFITITDAAGGRFYRLRR